MSTRSYGPFTVNNQEVCTGIYVQTGELIRTRSTGQINFGGGVGGAGAGAPVLDANGDTWQTPDDYPAPSLSKNSLICRVGRSWHQGGTDRSFHSTGSGQLKLFCNDRHAEDNTQGWVVTVERTALSDDADLPRPAASGALFQSLSGNLELLITGNQHPRLAGNSSGDLIPIVRGDSFGGGWFRASLITSIDGDPSVRFPVPLESACRFPCWFQATDGWFWGAGVQNQQVKYFARSMDNIQLRGVRDVPNANRCIGAPAMIQSRWGRRGNYELLVPMEGGGLSHFFAVNDSNSRCEDAVRAGTDGLTWLRAPSFGRANRVHAVRLLHSSYDKLEVISMEETGSASQLELVYYQQSSPGGLWSAGQVLPNSRGRVQGIPAFIQSSFGTESGNPGNFEVLAPSVSGGLLHWFRVHRGAWTEANSRGIHPGSDRFRAVHMTQGIYRSGGSRHGNFEVVAETGASPYGYGSLRFYWRNNFAGVWNGPSPIPV